MRLTDQLLCVAEAYAQAICRSEATVSKRLFGDGARLAGLRQGRDLLSRTAEDALQGLSDRWPEGAAWPSHVPRPAASPSAPAPSSSVPPGPPA